METRVPGETLSESIIDRRIHLLKEQVRQLTMLLDDPHPGLVTWMTAVPKVVREINAIMDGQREETPVGT